MASALTAVLVAGATAGATVGATKLLTDKPKGPGKEALAAQAAQTKLLGEQEAREKKRAAATRAVIAARSGRGQGVTLNPITGERGVIDGGKLGGA